VHPDLVLERVAARGVRLVERGQARGGESLGGRGDLLPGEDLDAEVVEEDKK